MTAQEKSLALKVGLSTVAVMLGTLAISTVRFGFEGGFWLAVLHAYLLFQFFNVVDVAIDWAALALIDPADPPIPGTAGAPGWSNYPYHAIASIKGVFLGIPIAMLAASLGWLYWGFVSL
ncbi:MAG: hypothetical protein AAGL69_16345 [Pseudomonadota bacterium]